MRKIDEQVKNAVASWKAMRGKNTKVEIVGGRLKVYLFDNLIFRAKSPSKWNASNCGWNSPTTRARLNACLAGVGAKATVSSFDEEMRVCVSKGERTVCVGSGFGSFDQSVESDTVGSEVERVVGRHSPDFVRFRVWRLMENGVRFLYGVYEREAVAKVIAKKISEGAM